MKQINDGPPDNLIIAALAEIDPQMLINPNGNEIQVRVSAIAKLLANPPPMIQPYLR